MQHRPEQDSMAAILQSCVTCSIFASQLLINLANLSPSFETVETKRRRNNDFQAALKKFFDDMKGLNQLWEYYRNNQEKDAENKKDLDKKLQAERDYINAQIEMRSPILIEGENKQKENEWEKVIQALQHIHAEIQQLDETLEELSQLESRLLILNDELLEDIRSCYDLLANQGNYTKIFKYGSLEPNEENTTLSFIVSFEEINKDLAIEIPRLLKDNQIAVHQLEKYIEKRINNSLNQKLAQSVNKEHPNISIENRNARIKFIEKSPEFRNFKENFITEYKNFHSTHPIQERLQNNLGAIAINEVSLKQVQTMQEMINNKKKNLLLAAELISKHSRNKITNDHIKNSQNDSKKLPKKNAHVESIRHIKYNYQHAIDIKNKAATKQAIQSAFDEKNQLNSTPNHHFSIQLNLKNKK